MFSDEFLEKIFSKDEMQKIPLVYQSAVIHVVEKTLEEEENDGISESEF